MNLKSTYVFIHIHFRIMRLPEENAGDGDPEHINRGLLELRARHEKRMGGCVGLAQYKEGLSLGLNEVDKVVGAILRRIRSRS